MQNIVFFAEAVSLLLTHFTSAYKQRDLYIQDCCIKRSYSLKSTVYTTVLPQQLDSACVVRSPERRLQWTADDDSRLGSSHRSN